MFRVTPGVRDSGSLLYGLPQLNRRYKFGCGVAGCGTGEQGTRPHGGNGLGRGVGVGLVCAGITAVMLIAALNNSKQRISRNRERLNFILRLVVVES